MNKLNVVQLPLDTKAIIEASAGTGKTYTVGLIVLRLLLEKLLPIEKIVLITFTEAATSELKKNTSEKIIEAYNIWKNGSIEKNDLTAIIEKAKNENVQRKEVNLLDAIARIDEMPVFTIHGFCRKLLSEFSFKTGNFEDMEIVTDTGSIKERVIADFWRENIKNSDISVELKPEDLSSSVSVVLNHPQAKLDGEDYKKALTEDKKNEREKEIKYAIAYKLAKEIREKFAAEKKKFKIIDFNDMIENCHKAIKNDHEKALLSAVRKSYDAILVDEFQDTDKMQFEIFDYLFSGKSFFMIGDPKQAIYGFRGGDVFAYKESRSSVGENQFSMNVNYRCEKSLLSALNSFFEANSFNGKMGDGIDYYKVECGKTELEPLIKKDDKYQPFVIWKGQEDETKQDFKYKTQTAVISEIKRLLSTGLFKPVDIAILLDSNNDCLAYKYALANERIPAIVSGGSVFSSEAANFLRLLLNAVCYNNNIKYIRALLIHDFCGFDPQIKDEVFLEWAGAVNETKTKWENNGVMSAIDFFMETRKLWGQIAGGINGERNVANIRQIMGILNEEEIKVGKAPEKINNIFAQLCEDAQANDEAEEKLETDEEALKIMTIHKSKGLQFNIVFVPDVSRSPRNHTFPNVYRYHKGSEERIAYFAEDKELKELTHKEEDEESVRLLYVALTRAKYRLYAVFSPCKRKKDGNISHASGASSVCREIFENFLPQNKSLNAKIENFTVENLNNLIENDYDYQSVTQDGEKQKMLAKNLPKDFFPAPAWSRTSFTGISRSFEYEDLLYTPPKTEKTIPAGKRMGTLLHSIFENLDFDANDSEIQEMIEGKLGGFCEFSETSADGKNNKKTIEHWVKTILNKNLPGNAGKLCEIDSGHKVAELHFLMKSDEVDLHKIKKILNEKIPNFYFEKTLPDKYLSGAIDLIFMGNDGKYYILDWKSNSLSDFTEDGMEKEAMIHHGYHLQYHIYAVALKRWLEKTQENFDFKKQFGGAYYIFVRGVNEKKENFDGIYYASGESIAAGVAELDECFKAVTHGK